MSSATARRRPRRQPTIIDTTVLWPATPGSRSGAERRTRLTAPAPRIRNAPSSVDRARRGRVRSGYLDGCAPDATDDGQIFNRVRPGAAVGFESRATPPGRVADAVVTHGRSIRASRV